MPRKGENIYKRKDGRWEGRIIKEYSIDGKAKYISVYGKTYSEVKKKVQDRQISRSLGKPIATTRIITYASLVDLWLKSVKPSVKESTYARYYQLTETHINPVLGKYQVDQISTTFINQFTEHLLVSGRVDGGGGLSPKTVNDILTVTKAIFRHAKSIGFAVCCDFEELSLKRTIKQTEILSLDEQKRLKNYLLDDIDRSKLAVLLSLYTGMRIGEVCALRWKHIDTDNGVIMVRETIQRVKNLNSSLPGKTRVIITEPKSLCSLRDIPIPDFILNILIAFSTVPEAFLLTGNTSKFVEPRTLQYQFKRYLAAVDITDKKFHSLRHTFATRCIELGFEVKSLSEILGHATVNITLNRYVHASMQLKRENMKRLEQI